MSLNCNLSFIIERIDILNPEQNEIFVEIEHEEINFRIKNNEFESIVMKDFFKNDFDESFNILVFSHRNSKAKLQGKGNFILSKYKTLKEMQFYQNITVELKCLNKLKGSITLKIIFTDYDSEKPIRDSFQFNNNYNEYVNQKIKLLKILKDPNLVYNYTKKLEEKIIGSYGKLPEKNISLQEIKQQIIFDTNLDNEIHNLSFQSVSLDLDDENEIVYDLDSDSNIKYHQTIEDEKKIIALENLLINENSRLDINLEKK